MKRALFLLPVILSGCAGVQSALDAQGQSAILLRNLIFVIVIVCAIVCAIVWLAVMAMLAEMLVRCGLSTSKSGVWASPTRLNVLDRF